MLNRHTPSKKSKSNKGLFRLSIVFLLALFGFNMLLIFLPEKVFAAPTIEEEYKVWRSYTVVKDCLIDEDFTRDSANGVNDQAIIDNIFKDNGSVNTGELFKDLVGTSDRGADCNTKSDIMPVLKQLGYKSVKDFADKLVEKLGKKSSLSTGDIENILQKVVTDKGVRLNLTDKADFQYWYWTKIYREGDCKGILSNEYKSGYETNTQRNQPYWYVDPKNPGDEPSKYTYANFKNGEDEGVEGLDSAMVSDPPSCIDIAGKLTKERAAAYLATLKKNPDEAGKAPGTGSSSSAEAEEDGCESNGGVLGWLMCPVVKLLDGTVGFLDQKIRDMLYVKSDSYFGADSDLMLTWKNIRNIAYLILIPIMLVMVIGTALGFEVFSAYTVKKALPRMVIAVIFIALSWYVCVFMVNFTNVLGAGAKGLVTAPLKEEKGTESGDPPILSAMKNAGIVADSGTGDDGTNGGNIAVLGAGTLVAGGALFATGMISIGIIMSTFATAALILGAIFLLLVFRQMLVIGLVLVAPLAILSWIFPGNDKLWKLWWGSFSKLLLIFPLIMLLAGVGEAFAMITGTAAAKDEGIGGGQLVALIIIIAAYIMPFLFIPFAFKWAGGVFGNLAGMVNDKNRGALDRLKKGRSEKRAQGWQNFKTGTGNQFGQKNRLARGIGTRVGVGGRNKFGFGKQGRSALDQVNRRAAMENIMKNPAWEGVSQDDNALHAGILRQDMSEAEAIRRLQSDRGLSETEAKRAMSAWKATGLSGRPAAIAAAQQLVSTGTGYRDTQDMVETLARASGGNASTATSLAGFANAETKKVGRGEMAPGFSSLNSMVQEQLSEGGVAGATYDRSVVEASRSQDAVTLLRGKTPEVQNLATALGGHLSEQHARSTMNNAEIAQLQADGVIDHRLSADQVRANASEELVRTAVQIESLDANKDYASDNNQEIIAELMRGTLEIREGRLSAGVHGPMRPGIEETNAHTQADNNPVLNEYRTQKTARGRDPDGPNAPPR